MNPSKSPKHKHGFSSICTLPRASTIFPKHWYHHPVISLGPVCDPSLPATAQWVCTSVESTVGPSQCGSSQVWPAHLLGTPVGPQSSESPVLRQVTEFRMGQLLLLSVQEINSLTHNDGAVIANEAKGTTNVLTLLVEGSRERMFSLSLCVLHTLL